MLRPLSITALVLGVGSAAFAALRPAGQMMAEPTDEHAFLQGGVGEWEGTMTLYMPGTEPAPIAATQSVTAVGPFWTSSTFECEFMGMPYTGTGVLGYDPAKKKFVGTWVDNMTTSLAVMEGQRNEEGALVMRWEAPGPTGEMQPHRYEYQQMDGEELTTFFMGEGEGVKTMEVHLKAAKMAKEASAK